MTTFDLYDIQADDYEYFEPTAADWEGDEECADCGAALPFGTLDPLCDRCDQLEYRRWLEVAG